MRKRMISVLIFVVIFYTTCISFVPPVDGDGMPAVSYREGEKEPPEVFSSIFESRQLATVALVNDTHQRISLFLSVYSLDPGSNLTILVPLRTLPVTISGEPIKEGEFRNTYNIERAEDEVRKQDMDAALDKLGSRTKECLGFAFGSMVWTLPGEYTRQRIHQRGGYSDLSLGMEGESKDYGPPEPIQHYEFDGFSIDVFNVSAGPKLTDYIEQKGLSIPESDVLDQYNNHFIAVIESMTRPPIIESDFKGLKDYVPNTIEYLKEKLKEEPDKNEYEIRSLKYDLHSKINNEARDNLSSPAIYELEDVMDELVDACFGEADFEGEIIHVELPLDEGKMFFPLGTSGGWPNAIGDIDILFKVPEDKALALPQSEDAFFDGYHWYLIQMEHANPDYDLESPITNADVEKKSRMEQAGIIYDNAPLLGFLIIAPIVLFLWFVTSLLVVKVRKMKDVKVLKNPMLWALLGLSLIISIPGALLVLLVARPVPFKRITKAFLPTTMLVMYPLAIFLATLGVVV
ncbi:MAG: hypothetical protein JSW28_10675 [Thermoplasmata archaeon]|nr:MAG: hypothetical protein JSW28_10675 [Thermoplasmata archaeon]